jgi:hypothetical protein
MCVFTVTCKKNLGSVPNRLLVCINKIKIIIITIIYYIYIYIDIDVVYIFLFFLHHCYNILRLTQTEANQSNRLVHI